MRKSSLAISLLMFGWQVAVQAAIPRDVKLEIDRRLIPAYRTGNLETVVFSGALIANQVGGALVDEIDAYLSDQSIEPLGAILARSRFSLLTQSKKVESQATVKELLLTVPYFQKQVQEVIAGELRPAIMKEGAEPPETLQGLKDALWTIHIYKNDLNNLDRTASLAALTVQTVLNSGKVRPVDREKLSYDFVASREQIIEENENRLNFETALRMLRVRLANKILEESDALDQKLLAAFALDQDFKIINDFVEQQRRGLFRSIQTPDLDFIQDTVVLAKQNHPRVFQDADLLFTGIHWWTRGRFGKGVAANGLLKGTHVKRNPAAGFPLHMPRDIPKATDPFAIDSSEPSPYVARRHEHTWSWENGGISLRYHAEVEIVAESDYFY